MRYVTRSCAERRTYGVRGVCTVGRPKAAKAALARQRVTARVPAGKNQIPGSMTPGLHTTARRRGVLIRAIDSADAKYPGIAMCIAILTALLYFHLASDPGNLDPAAVHMHVSSPTN
ncbi:hypothetical protein OKW32_005308 [Paraburkholderia youngii]